ncbi:MAG TPA: hypothetical protein VF622_06020 [Segetibacter sp.]
MQKQLINLLITFCFLGYNSALSAQDVKVQVSQNELIEKNGYILNRGWASGGHYTGLTAFPGGGF